MRSCLLGDGKNLSRNDDQNDLVVQDIVRRGLFFSFPKAWESLHRQFKRVHQIMSGYQMDAPKNWGGLRTVHEKMADGKTAYESICGVTCAGPCIPFGATASCKPISSRDEPRLHQFGKHMLIEMVHGLGVKCGWTTATQSSCMT